MRRPQLPKRLLENTKKLLKVRTRSRSQSPATREPFRLPDAFQIPHPHAIHIASADHPPPSHILLRGAAEGGLRQILRPESHITTKTDPVGIIICSCERPTDPDLTKLQTAQLYTWNELDGKIPTLHSHQHFVASNTIFLDEFETQTPQTGAPYLVALPDDISQARSLENTDQETLTNKLNNIIKEIPTNTSDTTQEDHIYMKLLNLPENPTYEEITPTAPSFPSQSLQVEPQAVIIWAQVGHESLTKNLNVMLSELNDPTHEFIHEYVEDEDQEDDAFATGVYIFTRFGRETKVTYTKDKVTLLDQRDSHPTLTRNNLRIGIITNYRRAASTNYVTELEAGIADRLYNELENTIHTETGPPNQTPSFHEDLTQSASQEIKCPQCGSVFTSMTNFMPHIQQHMENQAHNARGRSNSRQTRRRNKPFKNHYSSSSSDNSHSPHRRKTNPRSELENTETITPAFLNLPETPETYKTFFAMTGRTMSGYHRYAAPHFPPKIRTIEMAIDFKDIPERELKAWAKAYHNFADRSALDYQTNRRLKIKVHNSLTDLQSYGKKDIITALKTNAPVLSTHQISDLTQQAVAEFFEAARAYCLVSGIEWTDLYHFVISPRTIGDDIYRKLQTRLQATPHLKQSTITISTFLEKIITDLLPTQMTYSEKFDIIVAKHRNHLTAAVPSTDYLRQNLDVHASELQYLHPTYRQAQGTDKGWSTEDSAALCNMIIDTLQERIITDTKWKTKLTEIYITSPYKNYYKVPRTEVLNDLTKVIEAATTNVHTASVKGPQTRTPARPTDPQTRQDKCDICTKAGLPCNDRPAHCKKPGHQSKFIPKEGQKAPPSNYNIRQAKKGEKIQILYKECTKCHPQRAVANVYQYETQTPQTTQKTYTPRQQNQQPPPPNVTIQQNPDRRRPPPPSPPYSSPPNQNQNQNRNYRPNQRPNQHQTDRNQDYGRNRNQNQNQNHIGHIQYGPQDPGKYQGPSFDRSQQQQPQRPQQNYQQKPNQTQPQQWNQRQNQTQNPQRPNRQ